MKSDLSNKHKVDLDRLAQVESLIYQGKLERAKELFGSIRAGHTHPTAQIRAELDYYEALVLAAELAYDEALSKAQASFDYYRSSSNNKKIGNLQQLIAKIFISMGNVEQAEQFTRDSLATWRRIRDKSGIFYCYNRLAHIKFIQGDYVESARYLENTIDSFKATAKDDLQAEISVYRYYGNLARVYILSGDLDRAEDILRDCIAHNRRHEVVSSLIRNLLSLGYIGIRKRDRKLCQDCFAEVKNLLEVNVLKREEGILYEYLGDYHAEFNEFDQALKNYDMAIRMAEKSTAYNTLRSQTLRRRAEVYLVLKNYKKAYQDASLGLEIARKIGETVEEAGCLKVLALVSLNHDLKDDEEDYFSRAEAFLQKVSDKYEVARTHLAFAGIEVSSEDDSRLRWCQRHLNEARRIFDEIGNSYYRAVADLVSADLSCRAGDFDRAFEVVTRAGRYFEKSGYEDDLAGVHGLRRRIEKAMIDHAVSEENEYNLVRKILDPSEYQTLRKSDLIENLRFLSKRVDADRALVGIYDLDSRDFRMLAGHEFDSELLPQLTDIMRYAGIDDGRFRPFYITLPYSSSNGSSALFESYSDVSSMILIPIDLGARKSAVIYLQKDYDDDKKGDYFGKTELNISLAFADLLAFRAIESEKSSLEEDNLRLRSQLENSCAFPNIVTGSQTMLKMLERVIQVKDSPISVCIQGETGSGKDLLAKTIHYNSVRRDKRFISVNCAALPETLLESELFGYKKGAFTGADRDRAGLFEEAHGGTFFLDEIGEMPMALQAKLLRVIEDQEVVRLGDTRGRKVDVRILSATNRDLKEMMKEKHFRQDLYYRLSAMTIRIPPLRERRDDIPLLIDHFLKKSGSKVRISSDVRQAFINFSWPGNVRELDNEIKKLVLLAGDSKVITKELLSRKFFKQGSSKKSVDLPEIEQFESDFTLYDYIALFEKKYITEALRKNRWVKKHAANMLGIPESTLRLKIKDYQKKKD